jgi:hypothetical protein
VDVIDDSGPFLPAPYLTDALEDQWRAAWGLDANLPPDCPSCLDELTNLFPHFAAAMPNSRGALLSYTRDPVISIFLGISLPQFEEALTALDARIPQANFKHFYRSGTWHVMLNTWGVRVGETSLRDFLTAMTTDDPEWDHVGP